MKLVRSVMFSLSLGGAAALGAVACGGTVAAQAPGTTKAPLAVATHGPVKVVSDALGDVPLRPEQRTEVEKLAADAEARHAPLDAGKKELMLAFADQVERGTLDRGALQPKVDALGATWEKAQADDRAAFARLHDVLDADQRDAFVDALEDRFHGKRAGMKEGFARMKQLEEKLKLTSEQKDRIKDAVKEAHRAGKHEKGPHEHMKQAKKALDSFRDDRFDANAFPTASRDMARSGADRVAAFAEKILPILTPEQRTIAAGEIRTLAGSGADGLFGR